MKLLAAVILTALLLNTAPATTFESCSCTAKDNSCSAGVTCRGGCLAICPSGGCRASCINKDSFEGSFDEMRPVTMQLTGSDAKQVAAVLARISGKEVVFTPFKPDETISLDIKNAPLWNVLEMLSASGRMHIAGEDFSKLLSIRKALVSGEKLAVCIHDASVQRVVDEFRFLSGLPIHVTSGDAKTRVTFSAQEVSLEELMVQLSNQTGVQIDLK